MFTGIIEELGVIRNLTKTEDSLELTIGCETVLQDANMGDSITVNGVCLTVTRLLDNAYTADVSHETLRLTTLGNLTTGDRVNLERSITLQTRLGGHMVQGHVDGTATVCGIVAQGDSQLWRFDCPSNLVRYMILKGSVTVNGVSLTIAELSPSGFSVALIPKTIELTTFQFLKVGDSVNIETDMVGRYIYKFISEMEIPNK